MNEKKPSRRAVRVVARGSRRSVSRRRGAPFAASDGATMRRRTTGRELAGDDLAHQSSRLRWRLADADADGFERLLLRRGRTARAGDDGSRVTHGLALWCREPGDVPDHGLGDVGLDELGSALLGIATDLADHDDGVGLRVVLEGAQTVDVRRADDGVAADADTGRETDVAELVHHLVGQGARLADQAEAARLRDVSRNDARVGRARRDDAGAVRTDDAGCALGAALPAVGEEVRRVLHRDA